MNKRRGQALVEFIIIFPVLLILVFAIVNYGIIIYNKNVLEGKLTEVTTMYNSLETTNYIRAELKKDNIILTVTNMDNKYIELKITKKIKLIAPTMNSIIDNPFSIEASRVVKHES